MQSVFWDNFNSVYFIGIGGVSMSGLARFMLSVGKKVGGCDKFINDYAEELRALGVEIEDGNGITSVGNYDLVVYTDAIKADDGVLLEARSLDKKILSRGQFLYEVSLAFGKVIAVSGCHGKTTVTAMLAHVFKAADLPFTAHIGGRDKDFKNFYTQGHGYFITEACEYKKNFLYLKPDTAVVLNSDPDHLECYGSAENLRAAYKYFVDRAEVSVTPYGDSVEGKVAFGYDKNAAYYADGIVCKNGLYSFMAYENGVALGKVNLSVYGKHNILNALAVIAAARAEDVPFRTIAEGIENFKGVERRFEKLGYVNGALCIADYAHHPEEIRATLSAVRKITAERLFVVFQPHTYSRTKNLFKSFVKVLSPVKNLLIYRTFAAREYFDDEGSALTLSHGVKRSLYGDDPSDLRDFVSRAGEGDTVIFLGAGDIYELAKELLNTMNNYS